MKIQLTASRSIRKIVGCQWPRTQPNCGYNSEAAGVDLVSLPTIEPIRTTIAIALNKNEEAALVGTVLRTLSNEEKKSWV